LNLELMKYIDELYTRRPTLGSRKITELLRRKGYEVNRKRIQRLMGTMGIAAIYPKRFLSEGADGNRVYPYLLRDVVVERPDQVWASDITYIRMPQGFFYLMAILDWHSRYVISWRLSNTLDALFCVEALDEAFSVGRCPDIFNTDQGSQFTSEDFTSRLKQRNIQISMDGRGRCFDNIFVERLWRTVKYEEVYLQEYLDGKEAYWRLKDYWAFYNTERPHQSLAYKTPGEVYWN
jgi:putative transposase